MLKKINFQMLRQVCLFLGVTLIAIAVTLIHNPILFIFGYADGLNLWALLQIILHRDIQFLIPGNILIGVATIQYYSPRKSFRKFLGGMIKFITSLGYSAFLVYHMFEGAKGNKIDDDLAFMLMTYLAEASFLLAIGIPHTFDLLLKKLRRNQSNQIAEIAE